MKLTAKESANDSAGTSRYACQDSGPYSRVLTLAYDSVKDSCENAPEDFLLEQST